ncbi:hypothetical protein [Streptomyces sp. G-G2]|nr:hypothetical protein [Streptomyces sp. G-G2]MDJ0384561.1 hypothetical protein [Streptomyces sp. G-G2]
MPDWIRQGEAGRGERDHRLTTSGTEERAGLHEEDSARRSSAVFLW